jgi:hypothetical protein
MGVCWAVAIPLDEIRTRIAPHTTMIMNEFCAFVDDWCAEEEESGYLTDCPDIWWRSVLVFRQGFALESWCH